MELMDWKNMERGAIQQIRDAELQKVIGEIILEESVKEIKKLGGKTNAEEKANKGSK